MTIASAGIKPKFVKHLFIRRILRDTGYHLQSRQYIYKSWWIFQLAMSSLFDLKDLRCISPTSLKTGWPNYLLKAPWRFGLGSPIFSDPLGIWKQYTSHVSTRRVLWAKNAPHLSVSNQLDFTWHLWMRSDVFHFHLNIELKCMLWCSFKMSPQLLGNFERNTKSL